MGDCYNQDILNAVKGQAYKGMQQARNQGFLQMCSCLPVYEALDQLAISVQEIFTVEVYRVYRGYISFQSSQQACLYDTF